MNAMKKLCDSVFEAIRQLGPDCEKKTGMVLIGNGKTGKSLESKGGCSLMKIKDDKVSSPVCPSCYAVSVLNNYPQVRKVVMTMDQSVSDIILSAAHMNPNDKRKLTGVPLFPGDRLRLYGLTDFTALNMNAIRMLSKVYQIDIISKTLWMTSFNRAMLLELAKLPNINISLSFNKKLPKWEDSLKTTIAFIQEHGIGNVVGTNYTFTTDYRKTGKSELETIRSIKGVGVYHIVSKDKHKITRALGGDDSKVCGVFTEGGAKINEFGKGQKGSCIGCNFCRENVLDKVLAS